MVYTPLQTMQQAYHTNNSNNEHPGNKKEDAFMLEKQLTQINLGNNRKTQDEKIRGLLQQTLS
jgi:hypothetical protein